MISSLIRLKPRALAIAIAAAAISSVASAVVLNPDGPGAAMLATPSKLDTLDIPFEKFQLENGLTVVVHEDHKAPVVAVSIWYHVGSADEPKGKTGFAHLFEHLMFENSENHPGSYFKPFEDAGATDQNGTTENDRTNYFETVPTTAVDMALWMESDRMGHLLGAISQAELDKQRGVVQNEKRQDENQPLGRTEENIQANAFPANHPYHHDTIGSMKDLNAASLADVKQWFKDYYGAANTTIVLAGDITAAAAKEKVSRYFGDIPSGPPVPRQQPWVAPRTTSTRGEMVDHVSQVSILREWNVPQLGDPEATSVALAAHVLGGGKTSRLYERLVYKDKIADAVEVGADPLALAGMLQMQVEVKAGVDPAKVEAAVADEWKKFLATGPTQEELDRARVIVHAHFVRGVEKVGGFGGKAKLLAEGQVYRNDPAAYKQDFARLDAATPAGVLAAANKWMSKGDYTLTVKPGTPDPNKDEAEIAGRAAGENAPLPTAPAKHEYTTVKSDVDRSKGVPGVTQFPELGFPTLQRGKLKNGIEVVLAERHSIPVVQVDMMFDSGYAADQGRKLGTASFAIGMLDEGTQKLDSLAIARRRDDLGANVGAGCTLDFCNVNLNALKSQLDDSLNLFADIVRNPAFREADIARIRGQRLAGIAQEKTAPTSLALRVLPPLIYGEGHPYAIPFTGSGTEASITTINADDMRNFVRDYLRPDNAKIIVSGDIKLADIVNKLDAAFGDWKAPEGTVPKKTLATVAIPTKPRVFLMDRPGSPQSMILAGALAPSTMAPNHLQIQTMNSAFGGMFTSRINMNLRDSKHWSYGSFSFMQNAVGQTPFLLYAPVQSDKTADSVKEIIAEARSLIADKPLTGEEITKVKNSDVRALPGQFESTRAIQGSLQNIVTYHRPDDYVQTLKGHIEAQHDADIEAAAKEVVRPDSLTWVIVGDLKQIEQPIRDLKIGEVKVLDADGKVVR